MVLHCYQCVLSGKTGIPDFRRWPCVDAGVVRPANATDTVKHVIRRFALMVCEIPALVVPQYHLPITLRHFVIREQGYLTAALRCIDDEGRDGKAARQLADGYWTSKLGHDEDIEHDMPEDLAGGIYGAVVLFMSRPRQTE